MKAIVEGGVAVGVALTVCFSVSLRRGPRAQHEGAPARLVPSFDVNGGGLVEGLLKLAEQERVPMGIEYVDREALENPVKISLRQVTLAQALDALLPQESGYSWRLQDGVVSVSHKGVPGGRRNLLDCVLPKYSVPRCTLQEASQALWLTLYMKLRPNTQGIAGEYAPGNPSSLVGPFALHDVTVRQVLDRLVRESLQAAWVVQVPANYLGQLPATGLWEVVDYSVSSPSDVTNLLKEILRKYEARARGDSGICARPE